MRTLVTGFGPFLTNRENPSARLAETSGEPFRVLEVSYQAVTEFLDHLAPESFDRLLMIGLKGSGRKMLLETRGRNVVGSTPDVRKHIPELRVVREGEPRLKASTLWGDHHRQLHPMIGRSTDAGGYLCNFILYEALHRFPEKQVGFLHVPPFHRLAESIQREVLQQILAA